MWRSKDFVEMPPKFSSDAPQKLRRKRATSKVDFGHTFLTYSHFSGAGGDNIRRLCGGISFGSWAIKGGDQLPI